MITEIYDINAPELDVYARLTEAELKNKRDIEKGIFIAESRTAIELALDAGYLPVSVLVEKSRIEGGEAELVRRLESLCVPIYTASAAILEKLTGYRLSRGILSAMRRRVLSDEAEVIGGASRIAVLEGITDSTNVGAIFRSAAALGIDAVLVTKGCCDPLCRRSIRVSMGTVFQIDWTEASDGWQERLHHKGFLTAAMALSGSSVPPDDPRLQNAERLALIFGTEGHGLLPETIENSDFTVKIPMSNGVDSLNVAAASAVAFWALGKK